MGRGVGVGTEARLQSMGSPIVCDQCPFRVIGLSSNTQLAKTMNNLNVRRRTVSRKAFMVCHDIVLVTVAIRFGRVTVLGRSFSSGLLLFWNIRGGRDTVLWASTRRPRCSLYDETFLIRLSQPFRQN